MRIILRGVIILLLSVMVVGCSSSAAEESVNDPVIGDPPPINPNISSDEKSITLEVWMDLDFTRDDTLFAEIAQDFEDAYAEVYQQDITVNIQSFIGESIPQKVKQAVLAGTPPDVVQGHVYAMAGQGLAEPLNRYWEEWDQQAEENFLPAALEEVTWQGLTLPATAPETGCVDRPPLGCK